MRLHVVRVLLFLFCCAIISGTIGAGVRYSRDREWQDLAVKAKVGLYNTQTANFEFIKMPEETPPTEDKPAQEPAKEPEKKSEG